MNDSDTESSPIQASSTEQPTAHPPKSKPKPTRKDWLAMGTWLVIVIAVGIVDGRAFGDDVFGEEFSGVEFLVGFVAVPLVLALGAGLTIRPHGPLIEALALAWVGAIVFGISFATQIDLKPGSAACPTGCENDVGYAGVFAVLAAFLPLAAGLLAGRLLRRRVAP